MSSFSQSFVFSQSSCSPISHDSIYPRGTWSIIVSYLQQSVNTSKGKIYRREKFTLRYAHLAHGASGRERPVPAVNQLSLPIIETSGMKSAITIVPTTIASITIRIGSSIELNAATALSTSSS